MPLKLVVVLTWLFSILDGEDNLKLTHRGTELDLLLVDEEEDQAEEEAFFDEVHEYLSVSSSPGRTFWWFEEG